jgi:predicted  nucleic acid-binding Zn-ribbon protein
MNDVKLAKELSDHKHRIGSLEHRMDNAEEVIAEIHTIGKALEVLVYKAENTEKTVEKLAKDVEVIKAEPGDRLMQIKTAIIAALASGIITAIISVAIMSLK